MQATNGERGEFGVGTVTQSALQLGLAGVPAGIGPAVILTGLGLVWASKEDEVVVTKTSMPESVDKPDPVLVD
jgi:hypothetical protein